MIGDRIVRTLEASYLKLCLHQDLQVALSTCNARLFIERDTLLVCLSSVKELFFLEKKYALFKIDPYLRSCKDASTGMTISKVRLYALETGKQLAFPLRKVEGIIMPITNTNTSTIELLNEEQVLAELRQHAEEMNLSGSFTRMRDSKPYLFSDLIAESSGLEKKDMISVVSNAPYFPAEELEKFTSSIFEAQGKVARIVYKARRISDAVMCERFVDARLVSFQGELWRLVKAVAPVRPMA
jgi:hypothetical protein